MKNKQLKSIVISRKKAIDSIIYLLDEVINKLK